MMVVIQTHEAREEDPPWGYFLTCHPEVLDIELSPTRNLAIILSYHATYIRCQLDKLDK